MQNAIAGPHPRDVASLKPKLRIPASHGDIRGWRIAYSLDLGYFEVSPEVRRNTLAALDVFVVVGHTNTSWSWSIGPNQAYISPAILSEST